MTHARDPGPWYNRFHKEADTMTHDQLVRFSPYFFALVTLVPIVAVALLGTPGAGPCG